MNQGKEDGGITSTDRAEIACPSNCFTEKNKFRAESILAYFSVPSVLIGLPLFGLLSIFRSAMESQGFRINFNSQTRNPERNLKIQEKVDPKYYLCQI